MRNAHSTIIMDKGEYRLYGKPNCRIFDLIGDKEPAQTKSLGLLLSKSTKAMESFLQLVIEENTQMKNLLKCNWVVDCEPKQIISRNKNYRADIIIRFYRQYVLRHAIIVEAKNMNVNISPVNVEKQLRKYIDHFQILPDREDLRTPVIITRSKTLFPQTEVKYITWAEIIETLSSIPNKDSLTIDFVNYILKVSNKMDYYTHEVMSIPAGNTHTIIKEKCSLYMCPVKTKGQYATRASSRPLYLSFRSRGGWMDTLYKIRAIIQINLKQQPNDKSNYIESSIAKSLEEAYDADVIKEINLWCGLLTNSKNKEFITGGRYSVFLLDREERIPIQPRVKPKESLQGHKAYKLSQFLKEDSQNVFEREIINKDKH